MDTMLSLAALALPAVSFCWLTVVCREIPPSCLGLVLSLTDNLLECKVKR